MGKARRPWASPGHSRAVVLNALTDESLLHEGTAMSRGGAWPPAVLGPLEGATVWPITTNGIGGPFSPFTFGLSRAKGTLFPWRSQCYNSIYSNKEREWQQFGVKQF
jgi:hypothetical protein